MLKVVYYDGKKRQRILVTKREMWVNEHGKPERENNLPTVVDYYHHKKGKAPKVRQERWLDKDGKLHRENDLPAKIYYHESGEVTQKVWATHGKIHRDNDQPARIDTNDTYREYFFQRGKLHRDNGPAVYISSLGGYYTEVFYKNNKRHRENGPAEIHYNDLVEHSEETKHKYKNKQVGLEIFFINDVKTKEIQYYNGNKVIDYNNKGTLLDYVLSFFVGL